MAEPRWTTGVDRAAVLALVDAAAAVDGVAPLSEQTLLSLERGEHLLVEDASGLLAYATPADGTGELVVAPAARGHGIGRAMLAQLLTRTNRVWAHGDLPAARRTAAAAGLVAVRTLRQLRRESAVPIDAPVWPEGVSVRTFVPGRDEQDWLALNALAFAHHPEQGRWSPADLAAREAEDWFDPAGFFLAERDGALVGFHWTKIDDGVGEVYVVGVDPAAAGGGLGRALTVAGLAHLAPKVATVLLYVDGDNVRAEALYEHLGFTRHRADVTYGRPDQEPMTASRSPVTR